MTSTDLLKLHAMRLPRALHVGMAALFCYCAVVQWNDPDWPRWVAIYLAAALLSVAAARRLDVRYSGWITFAVAAVWAGTWAPAVVELYRRGVDVLQRTMSPETEEVRELGGLLIVATWSLLVAIDATLAAKQQQHQQQGKAPAP